MSDITNVSGTGNMEEAQQLLEQVLGPNGVWVLLLMTAISVVAISVVCWLNLEQIRQLGKMYQGMRHAIGNDKEYGDTKLMLSDFDSVVLKKGYMITLVIIFSIMSLLGIYIGYRITAVIQLCLLYFPIWKLTKSDGLKVSHIRAWENVNTVLFVWAYMKAILVGFITIVGVLGISLAYLGN